MIDRSAEWVAAACGGELVSDDSAHGPRRAVVDTRVVGDGDLFVGIQGVRVDGGEFAAQALDAGAWGVVVTPEHARGLGGGAVIAVDDPTVALAELARAWRRELGCRVAAITGSTGKTSTKDILASLLGAHARVHATRENLNTEIGLPLTVLEAERGTEVLVLEMAMRGAGQIAELARIAEPDVGVIVNVGPVHLELLGTVERVAAAKAELIGGLRPGGTSVVPALEPLLDAFRRGDVATVTFGPGGDVSLVSFAGGRATIDAGGERIELEPSFAEPHNLTNLLAAVAAARALGLSPGGRLDVRFSSLRGEIVELAPGITVVNDCYNANPMSMRAAIEHLSASPAQRRIAVLGTMAELGPDAARFHRELGELASQLRIDVLITVGAEAHGIGAAFGGEHHAAEHPEAAGALLRELARPGDRALVKGSRSAGLERVLAAA